MKLKEFNALAQYLTENVHAISMKVIPYSTWKQDIHYLFVAWNVEVKQTNKTSQGM